ncbi:hypothetical protein JCM5353_005595 [Sporobolomyces roseus]
MSIASQFVTRGKKIVAIGRNYAAHIKELNNATPTEPFFFLKPTSAYALSKEGNVEIPNGVVVHHEGASKSTHCPEKELTLLSYNPIVELGVVIGQGGREIKADNAMDHIAGYCLAIDYTGRNMQDAAKAKGLPWSAAKGFDTSCPVGEFIPKDKVEDPHKLKLWYKINGETKQSDSTGLMLYRIPQLIEHVSGIMTLEEGDVILTGTPQGVGPIKADDKISAGVETESGETLSTIQHLVKNREGGYLFKQK